MAMTRGIIRCGNAAKVRHRYPAFVLFAICACVLLAGCSGGSTADSSASSSSAAEATAAASVDVGLGERVEFAGISYQIPAGWVTADADNGGKYYYPGDEDRTSLIHVLKHEVAVPQGQEQTVLDSVLNGFLGSYQEQPTDLAKESYDIDGHPAMRASYTSGINGASYSFKYACVVLNGAVAMFVGASPMPDAPYDEVYTEIIDSIELLASEESSSAGDSSGSAEDSGQASDGEKAQADDGVIDADKFAAIKQGMSYDEVVAIVGSEGELQSSSTIAGIETASYKWESSGWGMATVMFQNGTVVNKTQVGVGGNSSPKVTMDAFNQIENGMSYEQVVEVLGGEGELMSETEVAGITMAIYTWDGNSLLSSCQVTFQNGEVTSKSQYGLE